VLFKIVNEMLFDNAPLANLEITILTADHRLAPATERTKNSKNVYARDKQDHMGKKWVRATYLGRPWRIMSTEALLFNFFG